MEIFHSKLNQISLKILKSDFNKVKISNSKDSVEYLRNFFNDDIEIFESFFLLLLNRANITIGFAKISQGGCVGTVVDVKILAKYCIDSLAQSVILCHNHPSGNITPSQNDKEICIKIVDTLKLFDCQVLDNLIITADNHFSFADEGLL